jgi:NADH dehydrogenase
MMEAAASSHVARQLFVSSYSAREDAASEYGRTKHRLERVFKERGYEVLRPGLVLGNGGIVARLVKCVKHLPVIPVPKYGAGEVPFISITALCHAIGTILNRPAAAEHNLFSQRFTSLDGLVRAIHAAVAERRVLLVVPVPARVVLVGLQCIEMLRIPVPLTVDNLKGFVRNQRRVHESTLDALGLKSETLTEAIEAASLR